MILLLLLACGGYYVHPAGSDSNTGTEASPWATLAKVNATSFAPGERINLARGQSWNERLVASSSGAAGQPIEYRAYGTGAAPVLDGSGLNAGEIIHTNAKSWLVFRDLETRSSAGSGDGYGVRVQGGSDVLVEDVVVRDAGKHSVGAIETTRATFRRVIADGMAPGQGYGGATAFVAYASTGSRATTWEDCEATTGTDHYPAWLSHGAGVGLTVVRGLRSHTLNAHGIVVYSGSLRVEGGEVNGAVIIDTTGAIVDGITVIGALTYMRLSGTGHTVRNVTMSGQLPHYWAGRPGAIVVESTNTRVLDSTVVLDATTVAGAAIVAAQGTTVIGCTLTAPYLSIWAKTDSAIDLTSDRNALCSGSYVVYGASSIDGNFTFGQWQAAGFDLHSKTVSCP